MPGAFSNGGQLPNNTVLSQSTNFSMFDHEDNNYSVPLLYDYDYVYDQIHALHLEKHFPLKYSGYLYGYVVPVMILLTLVTNSFIIAVLLKKHMRSSTNVLLAGMAFSDVMTGVFPLPIFVFFFTLGRYRDYVPSEWCMAYLMLYNNIPTVFHTASIWLTVGLATQRYIAICHPLKAKRLCSIPNVLRGIVIVYLAAFLSQLTQFSGYTVETIHVPSRMDLNSSFVGCYISLKPWIAQTATVYFNIYYWFKIIFIYLVPCTSLVVLNGLLIYTMRKAQRRRLKLLKQHKKNESRKLQESNYTTAMLVVVVGLFLLTELPLGIFMTLYVVDNTFELQLISSYVYAISTSITNFFILLSGPLNFFIYCGMSRLFRETFKRLFNRHFLERTAAQHMTEPTESGKTVFTGLKTERRARN